MARIAEGGGPMKFRSDWAAAAAKVEFSERNPYPGWMAWAPDLSARSKTCKRSREEGKKGGQVATREEARGHERASENAPLGREERRSAICPQQAIDSQSTTPIYDIATHLLSPEVALGGARSGSHQVGLIGHGGMKAAGPVRIAVEGDSFYAHAAAGSDDAAGDFSPIGNQDPVEGPGCSGRRFPGEGSTRAGAALTIALDRTQERDGLRSDAEGRTSATPARQQPARSLELGGGEDHGSSQGSATESSNKCHNK